jgi:flagellar motor switch protein FliG
MAQGQYTPSNMSGPDKAAVFMLAVGENFGREVWELLSDNEVRELTQVMSSLGAVDASSVGHIFDEFVAESSAAGSLKGNYHSTEQLLAKILPQDKVAEIMNEVKSPAGHSMWDQLGNVDEVVLASFLNNEYPQTVAVILQKIKPEPASKVLAVLPEEFALDVIRRMISLEDVQPEVLARVEETLRVEFMSKLARRSGKDGHKTMAEIFNQMAPDHEARFLSALDETNHDSAERIRDLMFTFEDLRQLEPVAMQTLMRQVKKDTLALALKGASEDMRQLFFANLSERATAILGEDMAAMGPVRLGDVEEAQKNIIAEAKDLAEAGEIFIGRSQDDDDLIY